jgi:hypothetical protein
MIAAIDARTSTEQTDMNEKENRTGKSAAMIFLAALVTAMSTNVLAESGWILWHELEVVIHDDVGPKEWTEAGTAKTFEQCVTLRASTVDDHLKRLQSDRPATGTSRLRGDSTIISSTKNGWIEIRYSCLPENQDPRH